MSRGVASFWAWLKTAKRCLSMSDPGPVWSSKNLTLSFSIEESTSIGPTDLQGNDLTVSGLGRTEQRSLHKFQDTIRAFRSKDSKIAASSAKGLATASPRHSESTRTKE